MNDQNEFNTLITRVGFTDANQRLEITNQGITTCDDLADLSTDELEAIFNENKNQNRRRTIVNQITLPILAKARLEAIRYEMDLRIMCSKPMDLQQIQSITLVAAKTFVKQKKEREDGIKHASTLPTPDVPKLDKGNWRAVRDSFLELLSRQTGSNGVPLVYILRDLSTGDYDGFYATLDERLIACVHHSGAKFDSDNASVYSLIMTHFEGTEADSTIKKFIVLAAVVHAGMHCASTLKVKVPRTCSRLSHFKLSETLHILDQRRTLICPHYTSSIPKHTISWLRQDFHTLRHRKSKSFNSV